MKSLALDQKNGLAMLALAVALSSCVSPPDLHLRHVNALQLGRSQRAEYEASLGEPRTTNTTVHETGRYEIAHYARAFEGFSGNCVRVIQLELKDGRLNGYLAGSSCDEDKTQANLEAGPSLLRGKGSTTEEAVVAMMGPPSGRARCPSYIRSYEDLCADATSVLAWYAPPKTAVVAGEMRSAMVLVSFNATSIVVDARVEEQARER